MAAMRSDGFRLASSAAAVYSAAIAASATQRSFNSGSSSAKEESKSSEPMGEPAVVGKKDPFAPRFDGLRFVETLVTAHR